MILILNSGEMIIAALAVVTALTTPLVPFAVGLLFLNWPNSMFWERRFKLSEA